MTFGARLRSATLKLTASHAAVRLLSLATMPVLTRLLAPDSYGAAAIPATLIALVSVIALSGMDMSYARTFHQREGVSRAATEAFAWRYVVGVALVAGLLSAIVWKLFIAGPYDLPGYLGWVVCAGVLLSNTNAMAQTRARLNNRYSRMAVAMLLGAVLGAGASVGIALWWRQDELALLTSLLIGYALPVIVLGVPGILGSRVPNLTAGEAVSVTKIGLAGIITAPMFWVMSSMDKWFLLHFEETASVGIYSLGYSVSILGMMVNNAVQAVWLPEAAREYEKDMEQARRQLAELAGRLTCYLALVWLGVTAAGGDLIRLMAGRQFHDAAAVVPYIAAGVFFYSVTHLANANLLLTGKLHRAAWWWLGGALLCLVLNWVTIPLYGRTGAALSQAISFGFVLIGVTISAQQALPLKMKYGRLTLIVVVIALVGSRMGPQWAAGPVQSLVLKTCVCLGVAAVVVSRVHPGLLRTFFNRLRIYRMAG